LGTVLYVFEPVHDLPYLLSYFSIFALNTIQFHGFNMHLYVTILLLNAVLANPHPKRATTLIPKTVFANTASLEQYFTYNYPWGSATHNGTSTL
jgi:hypothetical protein